MLDEMADFRRLLPRLAQPGPDGRQYTKGRVALVGDSAYGNTLGGFGTGLAVVGAYVLAGELAVADGDHTVAFARYNEIMQRYAKIAGNSNAGRVPRAEDRAGIKMRNWFFGSRMFQLMVKYADKAANDIDLPRLPGQRQRLITAARRRRCSGSPAPGVRPSSGRSSPRGSRSGSCRTR